MNDALRSARERTESRRYPGECLSRRELADHVNGYLWEHHGQQVVLDANYIAKLERGVICWPNSRYREALRAILNVSDEAELGFVNSRRAAVHLSDRCPRQLPPAIPNFVGRRDELRILSEYADVADGVRIASIEGTAGVGKTTLAIMLAHRVADGFPDGQLYLNLRGFSPRDKPMTTAQALSAFLDAFGVAADGRPTDVDAVAALYRSVVAGRRLLILLDNVRDPDQVRQLLPGSPGCLVVVTSRRQLTSLVARDQAKRVTLDLLAHNEALDLMVRILGPERVRANGAVVTELVERCARLPLALSIAAARALASPSVLVASLNTLSTMDSQETDIQAVFSWSYDGLSQPAARLFRLLGVHCGPDISLAAAIALAAAPEAETQALLAELTQAYLLTEHVSLRYRFHDLLRSYAAEQAQATDSAANRHAAMRRSLEFYAHSVHAAALALTPQRDPMPLGEPPAHKPETFADHREALAWCENEQPVLLAAVTQAAEHGFDDRACQIPCALSEFFLRRGDCSDWVAIQRIAVDAAARSADQASQAHAHRELGRVYKRLGRYNDAHVNLSRALTLYGALGDRAGIARSYRGLAEIRECEGRHRESLGYAQRALENYQDIDHQNGLAQAYNYIGWSHTLLGDHEQALSYCRLALDLSRELGNRMNEAATLDSMAHAYRHLGRHTQAISYYQHAIKIFTELEHRYHLAMTLLYLGHAQLDAGDRSGARHSYEDALDIFDELNHQNVKLARELLARLDCVPKRQDTGA